MFKSKRFLAVLIVAVLMLMSGGPVFAASRLRVSTALETSADLVLEANTWVYGMAIVADDTTNVFMGLYDAATVYDATSANLKGEIGEPTQSEQSQVFFPLPIKFTSGVSVIIETGVGWVYYGPEPTTGYFGGGLL